MKQFRAAYYQAKKNKLELTILLLILSLAAFLRLYRIEDFIVFLGDEGRDALVVKRMIVDHKWTLLGPTASVGGMFLGPIYYYFMIPFLWAFRFEPVGPAVMVALFGIATVFLVYKVARELFGSIPAILSSLLYAVSPLIIVYSRSSWNPNILPFFSLLTIYFLMKALVSDKRFFLGVGACLGIALQLHYLASFLFFITIAAVLLLEKRKITYHLLPITYYLSGFLLTFSPFILFELRHRFPNTKSLWQFIFAGKEVAFRLKRFLPIISDVFFRLFKTVVCANNVFLALPLLLFVFWGVRLSLRSNKFSKKQTIILLWITLGSLLFGFYQKPIYDYYLGFLYPAPFLLIGLAVENVKKNKIFFSVFLSLILIIFGLNLKNSPAFGGANRQVENTKENVRLLLEQAGEKPFNFALIANGNSDHAYRYFMEVWGRRPVELTHDIGSITEQLMVICENRDCQPLGNSLWGIAGFGRAEIVGEWYTDDGKKMVKLIHYREGGCKRCSFR